MPSELTQNCPSDVPFKSFPQFDFSGLTILSAHCRVRNKFACFENREVDGSLIETIASADYCPANLGRVGYRIDVKNERGETFYIDIRNYDFKEFTDRLDYAITSTTGESVYPCYREGRQAISGALNLVFIDQIGELER